MCFQPEALKITRSSRMAVLGAGIMPGWDSFDILLGKPIISALTPPPPILLPLEIASVYASIKSAFSAALRHERRRAERDNQILLAAGRDIGPDNDAVLKFRHLWIEPGLCDDAGNQQLL